jgi:hypothetical protein
MLSIAIPPMLWSVREAHMQRVNPVMASKARWLATEKLEDVIADRHSSTRGYDYLSAGNYTNESTIADFPGFTRAVTFNETGPDLSSVGTSYMTVTVTVSWTDAAATVQSLAVSTVLTEY